MCVLGGLGWLEGAGGAGRCSLLFCVRQLFTAQGMQRLFERGALPGRRRRRMGSFPFHCLWCGVHAAVRISHMVIGVIEAKKHQPGPLSG